MGLLASCNAAPPRLVDVDEIREFGELRVAVRPGFVDAAGQSGPDPDEAELLTLLAARLGVELRWIEAARHDQVLPMIRSGGADIGVIRFSPAFLHAHDLGDPSAIEWVEDVLVTSDSSHINDLESARGSSVHIHRSLLTEAVHGFVRANGLTVVEVPEEVTLEETMRRVASGRYPLTVTDSRFAHDRGALGRFRVLASVGGSRAVVWAVRNSSSRLRMAIDQFLFAERVLARTTKIPVCRDLSEIRRQGVLRLVTRNSATTYRVDRGGLGGFEYELVRSFARSIGVRLELSIPPPEIDPVAWLGQGHGDLAALHEPVAPEDQGSVLETISYRRVDLISVLSSRTRAPSSIGDLAGVRVAASRAVAELCRLMPLAAPLRAAEPSPAGDAAASVSSVLRRQVPVAVVDEDMARLAISNRGDLQPGPVIIPGAELAWLLNSGSPDLLRAANVFLLEARSSGYVRQLVLNEFRSWMPPRQKAALPTPDGALSPYDELLQWVGRKYEIDWRLLASLMYEESQFDPEAVGPGGSAGLFQFMPMTWRELGVEDPHHPAEAAEAGARYLRQLMDYFEELLLQDRVAMAIASYNVGPGHVFDARRLAREMGFDPDRWQDSVETAMLLLDDSEVARSYPSGVCRCRRAVGYTRRILRRYAAYAEQYPPA